MPPTTSQPPSSFLTQTSTLTQTPKVESTSWSTGVPKWELNTGPHAMQMAPQDISSDLNSSQIPNAEMNHTPYSSEAIERRASTLSHTNSYPVHSETIRHRGTRLSTWSSISSKNAIPNV